MPKRHVFMLLTIAAASAPMTVRPQAIVWPAAAWATATPESQGLSSAPFAAL
jgi:hypothetical protein